MPLPLSAAGPSGRWLVATAVLVLLGLSWVGMATTAHFAINLLATYVGGWLVVLALTLQRRQCGLRCVAVTVTLLACVGLLELPAALGWIDYRAVFRTPILAPIDNPHFEYDPELLFRRKPGGHFHGTMVGGDLSYVYDVPDPDTHAYDVRYDSNGFRNSQELGSADVVVIGDSFVEGTYVAEDQLMTGVMARRLGHPVGNFGVIAYGPQQELAVLRRFAMPKRPRTVVWVFFEGNDLKDALQYEAIRANPGPAIARKYSHWGRSFTKNSIQFASRLAGDPKPSALTKSAWVRDRSGKRVRIYFLYKGAPLTPGSLRALEITADALRQAHGLVTAQGARLIVAFAPQKHRVFMDVAEFDPGSQAASWVVNDLPDRLRSAVHAIDPGIAFVDLTPPLREAARAGDLPYMRDDAHWSAVGHRVAAEAVLAAMSTAPGR